MFNVGDRVRRIEDDFIGMEAIVEGCGEFYVLLTPEPDFEDMGELIGSTRGYDWHNTWPAIAWELVTPSPTSKAYLELFL